MRRRALALACLATLAVLTPALAQSPSDVSIKTTKGGLRTRIHCEWLEPKGDKSAHTSAVTAEEVMANDLEGDCGIFLVGTIPEARGRGISTRLMKRALYDAASRGCTISTLQASQMGYPVYQRLGYRDLGRAQLWERRRHPGR